MRWIRVGLLGLAIALLALGATQWKIVRAFAANTFALDAFEAMPAQPAVRFTPGAESLAAAVAEALPEAIARVEAAHGRPFPQPVVVYVCGTPACFERHTAQSRPAGTTLGTLLFIAPRLADQPQRIPRILAHELSHLHLNQAAGPLRAARLPPWFSEGLATWVSGGGGAERVPPREAARAIRAGRHFDPADEGGWFRRRTASDFGLRPHAFYREAALFVGFLHERDPAAFDAMLRRLEAGEALPDASRAAFGAGPPELWAPFVASLPGP